MNAWGIPFWLENEVIKRDIKCIYCGVEMVEKMTPNGSRKNVPTWEHITNDENIVTRENIARCCVSCNSSKGTKHLADWMLSDYCKKEGITEENVANIVKTALQTARENRAVNAREIKSAP